MTVRRAALAIVLLGLAVRIPLAFRYRFSTDEPQHVRVAWSIAEGLLPYRDFFDNHLPLFHFAAAPLAAVIGENPRIVALLRLAMIPFVAIALAAAAWIGRRLFSTEAGLAGAAVVGFLPLFLTTSLEVRPDVAWAALWLIALALLVDAETPRGLAAGGFVLGVAVAVSIKTGMLFAALAVGAFTVWLPSRTRIATGLKSAATVLAVAAVPPLLLVVAFAAAGALGALFDSAILHNLVPHGRWRNPLRLVELAVLVPALSFGAALLGRRSTDPKTPARIFAAVTGLSYVILLDTIWPIARAQDWLPLLPLVGPFAGAALVAAGRNLAERSRKPALVAAPLVVTAVVLAVATITTTQPWRDRTRPLVIQLDELLRMSDPEDRVMDTKGELVFRRRAPWWIFESVTNERIRLGLLVDDAPERIAAERAAAATLDTTELTPRTRAFLNESFVQVGHLRVPGRLLAIEALPRRPLRFALGVPGRYALVSPVGTFGAVVDGARYDAPIELAAGEHVVESAGPVAVVWAKAAERGFSPFTPVAPDP